jgi:EAL domain-containing protein (putative c-di-GMP-specific phosphodiesterase class I)
MARAVSSLNSERFQVWLIVIQAITQLVRRFGFKVVAEGVEFPPQFAGLRSVGCDLFQGYLLGRPMLAESVRRLLGMEKEFTRPEATGNFQHTGPGLIPMPRILV